jgi:hypothetical protein
MKVDLYDLMLGPDGLPREGADTLLMELEQLTTATGVGRAFVEVVEARRSALREQNEMRPQNEQDNLQFSMQYVAGQLGELAQLAELGNEARTVRQLLKSEQERARK